VSGEQSEKLATIRAFCAGSNPVVLFDEPGDALLDLASGKSLPLDAAKLDKVERRVNPETQASYLALSWESGRQVALAEMGVAFAPDLRNTGPLPELTEVVCFRDFYGLRDRLKHQLYGHREQEPTRDTVKLLMMCIAIVDGARAVGFEVGSEERELEVHLKELEKRAPPPATS
jgi:hypothetical protein